jgi:hypothetical protein
MGHMSASIKKAIPFLLVGGAILLFAGVASAKAKSAAPLDAAAKKALSAKAGALLAAKGFDLVPSAIALVNLDAITLKDLEPAAPAAITWAQIQRGLGRSVLVPLQFVDGKKYPFGGSGLPTRILALGATDAAILTSGGLYIEWIP